MTSRGTEEPPPPGEDLEGGRTQCVKTDTRQNTLWLSLYGVAVFLALVYIVLGMTASYGDNWKLAFVGVFILWLLVGSIWLSLDVRRLQRAPLTKRCLWHLGGCAASLYFFMSIVHITSDNLPQWLPTIMNCGVGASVGLQNIPSATRNRARDYFSSVISSIFGATQVIIRRDEQQLSERNETTSPRRRRGDIETGSIS